MRPSRTGRVIPQHATDMKPFNEFASDWFVSLRPELAPHRRSVADAAAVYLVRFDTFISGDYVHEALTGFFRRVADAVGWSVEESRRVSLRTFHEASKRYFSASWDAVSRFVDANTSLVHDVRRRHAKRMDIISNGLGPDENAVRAVDGVGLDLLISAACHDAPVVLKVFADYCSTCAAMAPSFESAARALYPKISFASLDGPRNLEVAKSLQCNRYPSVVKFLSPDAKPVRYEARKFPEENLVAFASRGDCGSTLESIVSADDGLASSAPKTPVDRAHSLSAETDPDPTGGLMGQWARMLKRQGIDQLEALVADRDAAMHSKTDDALNCTAVEDEACPIISTNGEVISDLEPVVILLGGGMGSGKSGSMHSLSQTAFWKERGQGMVVVEADAYKHADPMFTALNAIGVEASRVVHSKSLEHAETLFLKAVQARRDVVMDGTMAWKPYVEQTLSMLRDNEHYYSRGAGYRTRDDGSVHEQYWVRGERRSSPARRYRIEVVGVTVEPAVAVERGIVRKLLTGRGVPVRQQLLSHRQFSENFEEYLSLVDGGYLFDMSSLSESDTALGPNVSGNTAERAIIASKRGTLFPSRGGAWKLENTREDGFLVENVEAYHRFLRKAHINVDAARASDLFCLAGAEASHG